MKFVSLHVDSLSHVRSECCIARYISRSIDFFCLQHSLGLGKFFILVGISIFDTFFSSNRRYKEEVEILQLLLTYSHFQADFHRFQFTGNCESFARDIFRLPVALRKVSFFPACLIFFCFLFIIPLDLCLL